jgi:hypothetical protein
MTVVALWAAVVRYVWRAWRSDRTGNSAGRSRTRVGSALLVRLKRDDRVPAPGAHQAAAADLPSSVR